MSHTQDARLARGRKARSAGSARRPPLRRTQESSRRGCPGDGGHAGVAIRGSGRGWKLLVSQITNAPERWAWAGLLGRRRRSDADAHCSTHKVYTGLQLNSFTGSKEGRTRSCGTEGVSGLRDSLLHERVYCIRVNDVRPKGFPRPGACLSGVDACDWVETTCGDM